MKNMENITDTIKHTLDNSNLLRALLILIMQDKNVWDHEARIFIREGMALGYEKEFCENAINNILRNAYVNLNPPVFYFKENAIKLLLTGFRIMKEDLRVHPKKMKFLELIAAANNIVRFEDTNNLKMSSDMAVLFNGRPVEKGNEQTEY